jgi:hypothetical protein
MIRTKRILARKFAKSKKPLLLWGLYPKQHVNLVYFATKFNWIP